MSGKELKTLSCSPPIAKVVSWGQAGVDPSVMGLGLIPAVRKAVSQTLSNEEQEREQQRERERRTSG